MSANRSRTSARRLPSLRFLADPLRFTHLDQPFTLDPCLKLERKFSYGLETALLGVG